MNKNTLNKLILIFIILQPFIDVIVSIGIRYNNYLSYLGTIIRGLFFIFAIIWLFKNKIDKRVLLFFLLYILIAICYFFIYTDNSIINEVSNIMKIFYLPFMILFFSKYSNKNIDEKLMTILYFIYLCFVIIPWAFGFGFDLSSMYVNKTGYLGLFYGGNELSAVLLCLSFVSIPYIYKSHNYVLKLFMVIFTVMATVLIGTKSLLFGLIIEVIYYFVKYLKKLDKKIITRYLLFVFGLIIVALIIFPYTPIYKNFNTSTSYYDVDSVDDMFSINNIDKVIFSSRLSNLNNINGIYVRSNTLSKIFGLGNTTIVNNKDIELDIFDIYYSIGLFGFIVYVLFMIYVLKKCKLDKKYRFIFWMLMILSCLSGHIINKTMVIIYIALLFGLHEEKDNKTKILLVSNMYPNKSNKSYGIFVKNTKDILDKNGYEVDTVVMHKHYHKIIKLLAYIKLHGLVILKGIFTNYDYIYIHYVSHSSLGAMFIDATDSHVRIVFNAHGNDVVADTIPEYKNVKRSRRYLRHEDKVIVPSKYYYEVMVNEYHVKPEDILVYPSGGVDSNKFKDMNVNIAKSNLGLDKKYKYLGYVSRLEYNKGYDVFIKAINILKDKKEFKNYKIIIVGSGSEEKKLHSLIKLNHLEDLVIIKKSVSQDELVNIYNSLEMFIFPTYRKSESLGLVGLEAMACKDIVIASNNYGPTDYLEDGVNGFFFKPESYEDLALTIERVSKMREEDKLIIKENARNKALEYSDGQSEILLKAFKQEKDDE